MKLRVRLLSAFVIVGALNTLAAANPADESALLELEQTWLNAVNTHDVATLDAIIDDSYEADTPDGKQTKAGVLQAPVPQFSQTLINLKVKMDGDNAVISGQDVLTLPDGRIVKLTFSDSFARKAGQWRVIKSVFQTP